jgi:hypothetical protein
MKFRSTFVPFLKPTKVTVCIAILLCGVLAGRAMIVSLTASVREYFASPPPVVQMAIKKARVKKSAPRSSDHDDALTMNNGWMAPDRPHGHGVNMHPPVPIAYATKVAAVATASWYARLSETSSTFADSSIGNHPGTLSGSATRGATSLLNDDSNAAVNLTGGTITTSSFLTTTTGTSISFLQKFNSTTSAANLVQIGSFGSTTGYILIRWLGSSANSFRVTWMATDGTQTDTEFGVGALSTSVNYHVFVSVDKTNKIIAFWLNGKLINAVTVAKTPQNFTAAKAITLGDSTLNAVLDEVAVYGDTSFASTSLSPVNLFKSAKGIDENVNYFYASATGGVNSHATSADKAELQSIFSSGLMQPGVTVEVTNAGGSYQPSAEYTVSSQGASGNPITIKATPGARVTVDAVNFPSGTGVARADIHLTSTSAYVRVQGLELTNTRTSSRISTQSGSNPTDIGLNEGLVNHGQHNEIVNNFLHDNWGDGISDESTSTDTIVYGNVIFNNGWQGPDRGHGHGIYTQNTAPSVKLDAENIIFNNFGYGIHAFTTSTSLDNFTFTGNVVFQGGKASAACIGCSGAGASPNYFLGGSSAATNITYTNDFAYQSDGSGTNFLLGGSTTSVLNGILSLSGLVSVGSSSTLALSNWQTATASGLKLYGVGGGSDKGVLNVGFRNGLTPTSANWSWNNNFYWNQVNLSGGVRDGYSAGASSFLTFAQHKTATGFDANTTETIGPMTDAVYVRPNAYDNQCNIISFNQSLAATIQANLSGCGFTNGQTVVLSDAQNIYGTLATITYSSASPTVTITVPSTTLMLPTGFSSYASNMVHTGRPFSAITAKGGAQTIGSAPAAADQLTATHGTSAGISLAWVIHSNNGDASDDSGVKVFYQTSCTGSYTQYGSTLAAHAAAATFVPPNPGVGYCFKVQPTNSNGDAVFSNIAQESAPIVNSYSKDNVR